MTVAFGFLFLSTLLCDGRCMEEQIADAKRPPNIEKGVALSDLLDALGPPTVDFKEENLKVWVIGNWAVNVCFDNSDQVIDCVALPPLSRPSIPIMNGGNAVSRQGAGAVRQH